MASENPSDRLLRFLSAAPERQALIDRILEGKMEEKPGAPGGAAAGVEGYIDKRECARRLGRTVRSLDTYMAKGMVPFYKWGRTVAFRWSEVDEHIKTHFRVGLRG